MSIHRGFSVKKVFFILLPFLIMGAIYHKQIFLNVINFAAPYYKGDFAWEKVIPEEGSFTLKIKNGREIPIKYSPSCSNRPGTNPEFSFFVRSGKEKKLILLFSGGGACWSGQNCIPGDGSSGLRLDGRVSYVDEIHPQVHGVFQFTSRGRYGMLDHKDKENPVKDWNAIFTLNCDGSVFWGSVDRFYIDPFYKGGSHWIRHRGFDNAMAVLHYAKKRFANVKHVIVSGQSAGGYGIALLFPYIREAFPNAKVDLLVDSATGIVPSKKAGDRYDFLPLAVDLWDAHKNAPNWVPGISRDLKKFSQLNLEDLFLAHARHYPDSFIGEYTPAWDLGQVFIYHLMLYYQDAAMDWKADIYSKKRYTAIQKKDWCDWNERLTTRRRKLVDTALKENLKYRIFFAPGSHHGLGMDFNGKSNGVTFKQWFRALIENRSEQWNNVWCADCQPPMDFQCEKFKKK